jgi:DNA-binding transcriptional ArsR family regulator
MSKEQAVEERDDSFRALADPTRRKILRLLNAGEMSAGDLAAHFAISGPSMSHHFNVLKNADLIRTRRNGQQILYSLNTTVIQDLYATLLDLFPRHDGNSEEVL